MVTRMTLASVGKQVVLYTSYADTVRALRIPYTGSGERWQYSSGGKCKNEHVAQSGWRSALQRHEGAMIDKRKGRTGSLAWIEGNDEA